MQDQTESWLSKPVFWLVVIAITLLLFYSLEPILAPFLVGMLLVYLGDPIADRLEAMGMGRTAAVTLCFTVLLVVFTVALLILIPLLLHQFKVAYSHAPGVLYWVQYDALPRLVELFGMDPDLFNMERLKKEVLGEWSMAQNFLSDVLKQATASTTALLGLVANLALIPVVTFYLLRDWDVMMAKVKNLLPVRFQEKAGSLAGECNEVVGAFLRGQLWVMAALAVVYAVGLWVVGIKLALLVGMIAGLASIVPYLGFAVGIVAAAVASAVQFGFDWHLLAVAGVFAIGQAIEGMVLTPLLVGDRIGLHPVAVIFAIMAGGQLFGFTGVLLALPVAAVIMVLLRHIHELYKDTHFYSEQ